jgi:biopolymer transport protein ExbD
MRLTSRSGRHSAKIELQMTSMIDCVFLLLIFFMVTSSFQKTERELDPAVKMERPSAGRAASDLAPAIVDVVRGAGGDFIFKLGGRELATREELTQVLSQFENKVDVKAIVHAADDAPVDLAAAAIQACKDARFVSVSYDVVGK